MKRHHYKLLLVLAAIFIFNQAGFSQTPTLTCASMTACPCQTVLVNPVWNNVASPSYTIIPQPPAANNPTVFTGSTPVANCSNLAANFSYVLIGSGIYAGNPITQTVTNLILTIQPPAPMSLGGPYAHCTGQTATITALTGGSSYTLAGPCGNTVTPSNIILISGLSAPPTCNGAYTVTSVIGGCTVTGVTSISVAPNHQITVNTTSNICQGENVTLTANLTAGSNFIWTHVNTGNNVSEPGTGGSGTSHINNATPASSGVYRVDAYSNYNPGFGNISCPASATTLVNVVGTSPVLPIASPGNNLCQGTNLSLSANAPNATGFTWQGPSFNSTLAAPSVPNLNTINTGPYTVTAKFSSSFTTCTTSAVIQISVVPVSVPVINMANNACQGSSVPVSASVQGAPAGGWEWTAPSTALPGGQLVGSASFTMQNVQPNYSGVFYVKAVFPGIGITCFASSSSQLNVVPVNTISVIPPGVVCSPNNAFLQSYSPGANLYTWQGPNNFATPGANVYVYYPTAAANGIYTVTAYFGGGNITCPNTNTLALNVSTPLNFTLVPWQQTCFNNSVAIVGPSGATGYTWTSSTGFTSNDKDVYFPAIQPGNAGSYTLNIMNGPCRTTNSTEVIVVTPIHFSLTPANRTICRGDTISLEAGAFGGSENYAYSWNPPLYISSISGPKQTATPLGSVSYNLIVHDIACPSFSLAHSVDITVNQPPEPKFNLTTESGCAPLKIKFNSQLQDSMALVTYDLGKGNEGVLQGAIVTATWNNPGSYNIKVYTVDRATKCSGVYNYPYPIVVYPRPGTTVSWFPEKPTTIDDITFTSSSKTKPITYKKWEFLGAVIPNDTSKPVTPDTTNSDSPRRLYPNLGKYPVMLITSTDMGCVDTVGMVIEIIDGLQIFVPNAFTPNDDGINDVFMVKGIGMSPTGFTMDIFDRAGKVVFTTKSIEEPWDGKVKGQLVKDATYTYLIKVVGMNGEGRKEFTGHVSVIK